MLSVSYGFVENRKETGMKLKVIECPICGHLNRNLDLEDSNGLMECERCGAVGIIPERWPDRFETQRNNTIKYLKPVKVLMHS